MIIYLLSGPRNYSTALMYSFDQRTDTVVIDEPFYGIWLKKLGKKQPFFDEVLQTMECTDPDRIHDEIESKEKLNGNVFVKNMANTVNNMNPKRITSYRPILLIRHPAETIVSHIKIDSLITVDDLCLEHQVKLYDSLKERTKEDPIVIDGNELRKDPLSVLTQVCYRLGLPFTDKMLSWPAGPKPIDGIWAQGWYGEVHSSTGFRPPSDTKATVSDIPSDLMHIYDEVLPYYERLRTYSIRA
jgi:hypothetical protein